jgi:hypothetical protein
MSTPPTPPLPNTYGILRETSGCLVCLWGEEAGLSLERPPMLYGNGRDPRETVDFFFLELLL